MTVETLLWIGVFAGIGISVYVGFIKKPSCPCEKRIKRLEETKAEIIDGDGEKVDKIIIDPKTRKAIYALLKQQQ